MKHYDFLPSLVHWVFLLQLLTVFCHSDSSPISSTNHSSSIAPGHTLFISTSSSMSDEDESANAIWTDEKRVSQTAPRALSLQSRPVGRWCLDCICQASSGCEVSGCEGGFCGPYKISREYWIDAGRPGFYVPGDPRAFTACGLNKTCAEQTIQNYMTLFRRDCNADGQIDCWDFSRIHLAGPGNCFANWIENTPFWDKFVECQEELEAVRPANNGQSASSSAFVRPSLQSGSSSLPAATEGGVESGSEFEAPLVAEAAGIALGITQIKENGVAQKDNQVSQSCLDCIFQVVTGCEPSSCSSLLVNDPYQISREYWLDAGRPWSKHRGSNDFHSCARNKSCAEQTIRSYMRKFGRDCNKDGRINCLDFARIHKAGPYGCDALWLESHNFLTKIKSCWSKSSALPTENLIQHGVTNTVSSSNAVRTTRKPVWQTQWVKAPLIVSADPSIHKQTPANHFPQAQVPFTHFPRPNPSIVVPNNAIPVTAWRGSETSLQNWTAESQTLTFAPTKGPGRQNSKHPDKIVTQPLSNTQSINVTHRVPVEQIPRLVDFNCMRCLCEASSDCEERSCALGLCGPYQISREYWDNADMARVSRGIEGEFETCATNKSCSETVIQFYMSKFQRDCDRSGQINCWDFARLHVAGVGQCHAQWVVKTAAWAKFTDCQSRHAHRLRITTAAPVEQNESQGQIPPGRRKPPFVIVPPENERFKSSASERLDVAVPFQDAPEVILPPLANDDDLLTPTNKPVFVQPNFPQQQPFAVLPPANSKRPEFQPSPPIVRPEFQPPPPIVNPAQEVDVNRVLDRTCFNCLCQASTNCSKDVTSCVTTGPNQYFCGVYHISWAYWADSGRPGDVKGDPTAFEHCLLDPDCAERSVLGYMTKFQRDCNGDGVIDCIDFGLIHKMGPSSCTGDWVYNTAYWQRFAQCWGRGLDFRFVPKPEASK